MEVLIILFAVALIGLVSSCSPCCDTGTGTGTGSDAITAPCCPAPGYTGTGDALLPLTLYLTIVLSRTDAFSTLQDPAPFHCRVYTDTEFHNQVVTLTYIGGGQWAGDLTLPGTGVANDTIHFIMTYCWNLSACCNPPPCDGTTSLFSVSNATPYSCNPVNVRFLYTSTNSPLGFNVTYTMTLTE